MPEPVPVGLNEREVLWKQHEAGQWADTASGVRGVCRSFLQEGVLRQAKERRGPPKDSRISQSGRVAFKTFKSHTNWAAMTPPRQEDIFGNKAPDEGQTCLSAAKLLCFGTSL